MKDETKTKTELINELKELRRRVKELEREPTAKQETEAGETDWRVSFMAKHAGVGIWRYDLESGDFYANPEWYEALADGEIELASFQFRMLSSSRDWMTVQCKGIVLDPDQDGEAPRMFGIFTDFTCWVSVGELLSERRELRKVLSELFREMIASGIDMSHLREFWKSDSAGAVLDTDLQSLYMVLASEHLSASGARGTPFFVKDPSMKYLHVSSALAEMLGTTSSRMLGQTDDQLFGAKEQRICQELIQRIQREEGLSEVRNRKVNGKILLFFDSIIPVNVHHGEEIRYIYGYTRPIAEFTNDLQLVGFGKTEYVSDAMRKTLEMVDLAAQSDEIVLLTGESGTGKDYLAKIIHKRSKRSGRAFLRVNCAAIPPELAESELFGHEKGAFTSAMAPKKGLVELANGGTLFLNEIGELPLSMQAKLNSFLDTGEFMRVGGETPCNANVRILAATNRDLEDKVSRKRFREDLYHRINVIRIIVPPLRERKEDIVILARQFLTKLNSQYNETREIDPKAIPFLEVYHYPGNVRELEDLLRSARALTKKQTLDAKSIFGDLVQHLRPKAPQLRLISDMENSGDWEWRTGFPRKRNYNQVVLDLRRALVAEALRRAGGSPTQAGGLLGMTKDAMMRQIKTLSIGASD